MKKIITLCMCLFTGLAIQAQGFVFQYQGQDLADGETVVIAAEEDLFGDLSCETNSTMNPSDDGLVLKLLRGTTASGTATLQVTQNTLDADVLQWCMGGNCQAFQTSLTKQFAVTTAAPVKVQFDAIGIHSKGYLLATLKVTIGLESRQVNIVFDNDEYTGIKEIQNKEMVNGKCFDLLGRQVKRTPSGMCIVKDGGCIRKVVIK